MDTLCSGQVFTENAPGSPLAIVCNGTADATTFHATCSGSDTVFTDCLVTFDIQVDGVRTGESYRSVTTTNTSYSGTGTGCDLLPATCTRRAAGSSNVELMTSPRTVRTISVTSSGRSSTSSTIR